MNDLILEEAAPKHALRAMNYRQEYLERGETHINGSGGLLRFDRYDDWLASVEVKKHLVPSALETPSNTYFSIRPEDGGIIGTIQLRHHLTEELKRDGGNIGYGIRPSERGKGYGTRQLMLVLERARALGLPRVMISCVQDNFASAKVAMRCGGVWGGNGMDEERNQMTDIYWITLQQE